MNPISSGDIHLGFLDVFWGLDPLNCVAELFDSVHKRKHIPGNIIQEMYGRHHPPEKKLYFTGYKLEAPCSKYAGKNDDLKYISIAANRAKPLAVISVDFKRNFNTTNIIVIPKQCRC